MFWLFSKKIYLILMQKKILIYNFFFLIFRQIILLISGFLIIRFLLKNLGVDGYATYVVIFSFVTLLSFIYSSISIVSIRNFSHAIALKDSNYLKILYNNNLIFNFVLGICLLFFFGLIGVFVVENFLNIINEYKTIASKLFIVILISYIISIQCQTFESLLKAKEKMVAYSIISIIDTILKLLSSIILIYMPFDNLENYSLLLLFCSICTFLLYFIITKKIDPNLKLDFKFFNLKLLKKNFSFLNWSLFGQFCSILRLQGNILLFNHFFNSSIIISRSVSMQIAHSINLVAENLNINFNPFLIKKFYNADRIELNKSLLFITKTSFLLTFFFAMPMLIETEFILLLLFDDLTQNIVLFTKLAIIDTLIFSSVIPIANIARAPAKMKSYELILGSIQFLIMICGCFFIVLGYAPAVVFIISIVGNFIAWFTRIIITSKLIAFNPFGFIKEILFFIFGVISVLLIPVLIIKYYLSLSSFNSIFTIFGMYTFLILIFFKINKFSILKLHN